MGTVEGGMRGKGSEGSEGGGPKGGGGGGAVSTASIVEVLGLGLSDATATQVEGSAPGVTPFGNDAAATLR